MAFEGLSSKLQEITRKLKGKARITESDLKEMLREVKLALLEADVNYKIVKETTYYRYRDKLWRYSGDVRYYYPQNKVIGSDVIEFYKESPSEIYPFKQVSQNYAYKWYIENDDGLRHYYPSGSTDVHKENTYYLTAPVKGAIRDEATKTYAAKYYRVEKTDASDYYPTAPSNNAVKLEDSLIWSDWSEYSLQVPKINPYGNGNREIETRVKVEVIPIEGDVSDLVWSSLTSDYVTEQELISQLRNLGYNVNTIDDVAALKDIKYDLKQTYRDEVKKAQVLLHEAFLGKKERK